MLDNQLLLPTGKLITFNVEQFEVIQKIREWLKSDKTFFTLAGYAGTGKSTIIKKILDEYHWGVVVSAPTHKAVKVIKNTTNKEGATLQSLLGLRPDVDLENFSPNFPQFAPIALPRICNYNLVIVDEVSMLNKALYNLIKELTINGRTKVLFVGDEGQLPPVGEVISVVFIDEDIIKYRLTKVERQKSDNPLLSIYDELRNNFDKIDGGFLNKTSINYLGDGIIFTTNKLEFRKLILEKFKSDEYKKDSDFVKGLAWKNDTVMLSNKTIRDEIFGKNSDIVEVNDILMGYRSVSGENNRYNIIENSADYHVVEKSKLEENSYGISGYCVKLREDLLKGEFKFQDVFIIDVNNHENLHLYAQMHDFFRDMAKSNKKMWVKYYEFRRNNILMKNIDKYENGLNRNSSDVIKRDIDYGYFLTVHKSQGSTYQHVMVIGKDLDLNWDVEERNKLRYVAFSRPVKTCTVLTNRIDY